MHLLIKIILFCSSLTNTVVRFMIIELLFMGDEIVNRLVCSLILIIERYKIKIVIPMRGALEF